MATTYPADTILPSVAAFLAEKHQLFIDGQWVDPLTGEYMDIVDPSTGGVIAKAPLGGAADVDLAVKAARRAFDSGPWSKMLPPERRMLLLKLADAIEAEIPEFAMIDSINMGMPIIPSRIIIGGQSVESLRYSAGWIGKVSGEVITASTPDQHCYTLKEPVGVVGAIVPWNSPLLGAMGKLAPALAAGCTVVLKPAELTPLSVFKLSKLIKQVGFPDGVVNIVNGLGTVAGQALIEHPGVNKIAFTGSTAVGQHILRTVATNMTRVGLELGGKSPFFILPDADLDRATEAAAAAIFRNAGQICAAGSRLYVHKSIYDNVVAGVAERAKSLKVGGALEDGVQMGPIVSHKQKERVLGYIETGRGEGAEIVAGGGSLDRDGFFVKPTVLAKTDRGMRVVKEEIFGPVLVVEPFDDGDIDNLAALGNDSIYGLAAYIWTSNLSTAHKLAKGLRSGITMINGGTPLDRAVPFGGFKQSGWGREYGREGFESFLETKSVTIAL